MRLPQISEIQTGFTLRKRLETSLSGGVLSLQLRNLGRNGVDSPDCLDRLPLEDIKQRYLVSSGDVLFRSRGERTTACALDERFSEPAVAVSPIVILRPDTSLVLPDYLAWSINQRAAQRHLDDDARGTSMRMVPKSALDSMEIDLPDIETQRRIIALDDLARREHRLSQRLAETRRQLINLHLVDRSTKPRLGADQQRKAS